MLIFFWWKSNGLATLLILRQKPILGGRGGGGSGEDITNANCLCRLAEICRRIKFELARSYATGSHPVLDHDSVHLYLCKFRCISLFSPSHNHKIIVWGGGGKLTTVLSNVASERRFGPRWIAIQPTCISYYGS